jgi:hypothetical protein
MSSRMHHNFLFPRLLSLNHNFPPAGQLDFSLLPRGVGILRPPGGSANDEEAGAFQGPQAMAEIPLVTVEGADQLRMVACDRPPKPVSDRRPAIVVYPQTVYTDLNGLMCKISFPSLTHGA